MEELPIIANKLCTRGVQQARSLQLRILLLRGKLHELILSEVVIRGQKAQQQEHDGNCEQNGYKRLCQPLQGIFQHQAPLAAL